MANFSLTDGKASLGRLTFESGPAIEYAGMDGVTLLGFKKTFIACLFRPGYAGSKRYCPT
jgi:hypothetical protein